MDPDGDTDPAILAIDLQDANKNLILNKCFTAYYFLQLQFTSFFKVIKLKRSHKTVGIKVFLTIFAL
jgi:hypothetical protein